MIAPDDRQGVPRQNRVTPWGALVRDPGRGLFMGNRGILHDEAQRIHRRWTTRAWITCLLEFKGRKRVVMAPRHYTELFFLDEAAAFAAGHRPCAECRRADFRRFVELWREANGGEARAPAIDRQLHAQRLTPERTKRTYDEALRALPSGSYVERDGAAWLVLDGRLLRWSPAGYIEERRLDPAERVAVLTPAGIVAVLKAGYSPVLHPSSGM